MADAFFTLSWVGDRCLRVSFAKASSKEAALSMVHAAWRRLSGPAVRPPGLLDLTPAYQTLLLTFDPMTLDLPETERTVGALLKDSLTTPTTGPTRTVEIPVCYDAAVAPDLVDLASFNGLRPEQVVELHSSATYTVAFIGFSPGFPYLAGLPEQLQHSTACEPEECVTAGSVGIAGDQTGIYPQPTSGGWRIIGQTPARLFDVGAAQPSLLAPGDHVKFVPVSLDELRSQLTLLPEAR